MKTEDINKLAFAGAKLPDGLNLAERCLFLLLKDLYRSFKDGDITKAEGDRLKKKAMTQFAADLADVEFSGKLLRHNAEMWKKIESAAAKYKHDKTIANADAFIAAVYGTVKKEGDQTLNP